MLSGRSSGRRLVDQRPCANRPTPGMIESALGNGGEQAVVDLPELLKLMADQGGSDLFLTVGAPPYIKIGDKTTAVDIPAFKSGDVRALANSVMNDRQRSQFEATLEANLSLSVEDIGRYRINVYLQRGEVAMVVRLLKSNIPDFDQLGLPSQVADLAMLKDGLVLVVGPTGAGKTSTAAAMVDYRARNASGHILTIEDPIEFLFRHRKALVDQREVGLDTLTIGAGLRNAMREQPDLIMLSELRDTETAQYALTYAQTGHLCLTTLYARDVTQAIERFINFFPEPSHRQRRMDVAITLKGIIAQRLLRSTDGTAVLATEILLTAPDIAELILQGQLDDIKAALAKHHELGMRTFEQSLSELYSAGRITRADVLEHADSAADLVL